MSDATRTRDRTDEQTPEQPTIPPQSQDHVPGHEHEMSPAPDHEPRYPGVGKLKGEVAIITGGDSGIGRAVAQLFAREGADVAIVYYDEHEDANATQGIVQAEGGECLLLPGDQSDPQFCRDVAAKVMERFGRIDVLINNAAVQQSYESLTDIPDEWLERTVRVNSLGYMFMTKAVLPHLKEGARIINTTSINAFKGNASLIDYSTTKGANLAFTRSMAANLVSKGIRVNAVAPGPVWTPFIPSGMDPSDVEGFGSGSPMGRAGQPWELAPAYLFLASLDSTFITGQTIHPNGGMIVGA